MLNEKDFPKIRDYIIGILPEILEREPSVAETIQTIVADVAPSKQAVTRVAEKMAEYRVDTQQSVHNLRSEMNQQFEQVDQRFEQVDQRFEQVDQRFDQVDQRFEQVDQRFDQVDQRFETMHKTQLGMKRDIAKMKETQDRILRRLDGQEKWLRLSIGQMGNDKGQSLEDFVAAALAYGLNNADISADKIRLRQPLVDETGLIFYPGFTTEIDLIVEDHRIVVFEVKATTKNGDPYLFSLKIDLLRRQNPEIPVEGILISIGAREKIQAECDNAGIKLMT